MMFTPVDLMMRRVNTNGDESDTLRFLELLYAAEFVTKLTACALVAALEDDVESHRYQIMHALVRADGVGEWAAKIEDILTGPAANHLPTSFLDDRRVFNERVGAGFWQYDALKGLQVVLDGVTATGTSLPNKATARSWFSKFAEVRNKTRGHGAITPATCSRLLPFLDRSLKLVIDNNPVFSKSWAYLHRNMSGKYRVVGLGGDQTGFDHLKRSNAVDGYNFQEGVYIMSAVPRKVDLIYTDINVSDFAVPNGDFNGKSFEVLSPITGTKTKIDATPYLAFSGQRPSSETEGTAELEIIGNVFTNIPNVPAEYVTRLGLETEVLNALSNDRHPIVTLVGRGGIGKTSLALSVLHRIAYSDRYDEIIWFSARDVDLTFSGPKVVRPRVLTEREIAEQYFSLRKGGALTKEDRQIAIPTMADDLRSSAGGKKLFVFDNFETVRSPIDLFSWIDTHIRLPNKVVITSRFREFKADYPIDIQGMEVDEAETLISRVAGKLGVSQQLVAKNRDQIIDETSGHPYVIKIILGEIANTGKYTKLTSMFVRKEDILDALFERTYSSLTPMAVRVFLTLCGWRSLVPQLAAEAILFRHAAEGGDPEKAIDELVRMSLIERTIANDGSAFLGVPLTAALFGKRKLEVSPHRDVIESDILFLKDIGATTKSGLKDGIKPRVVSFFRKIARRIEDGSYTIDAMRPIMEFVARGYPSAWLLLADLELELRGDAGYVLAASHIRRFLELKPDVVEADLAWNKLIIIYRGLQDVRGACNALLRLSELSEPSVNLVSYTANWLNNEKELIIRTEIVDRETLFKPLAELFEGYTAVSTATDLSRLAWLYLHADDEEQALRISRLGLEKDADNIFCLKLVEKLSSS